MHEETSASSTELRAEAEKRLRTQQQSIPREELDRLKLIHELHVHQIELEVQNEMLAESLQQVELLRAKYHDLYDFAPVGYFTVATDGFILESNLKGANLLSSQHPAGRHLSEFFEAECIDPLIEFLRLAAQSAEEVSAPGLQLRNRLPMPLVVNAKARAFIDVQGKTCLRLVLMDVSALKMATDDVLRTLSKSSGLGPF
ncbi:MAG: hypothetical protein V4731_03435 [Pseudomonadota bacterium]